MPDQRADVGKRDSKVVDLLANGHAPKGVSDDSIEALEAIRKVGNIGAHMEADINVIVEVDPDEAKILLSVIEQLFADWYGERETRKNRFSAAKALADAKASEKRGESGKP